MESLRASWEQVEKQLVDVTMDPANKDFPPQMGLDGKHECVGDFEGRGKPLTDV